MTQDIPLDLVTAIKEGRAVLFLGAGASRGATNIGKQGIPDGDELAQILAKEFLDDEYQGYDFRTIYDLSCSTRDTRTVQKKLFEVLNPFEPADFHCLIPTFAWAGIVTTNYDLIVERAYQNTPSRLQKLIANIKDGDGATEQLSDMSVLFVKLHGCITRYQETKPPMIASTEQLIAFREGRHGQFATFLEWAKTKTMIFCGYKLVDPNLRTLFNEVIKEGDDRPRHYIINNRLTKHEEGYWRDRRVVAVGLTFENFLRGIDEHISKNARVLGSVAADTNTTTFTRFVTAQGSSESTELTHYLRSQIEHIGPNIDPPIGDAKKFYRGFDLGWYPFASDLDVRLPVVDQLLAEHVIQHQVGLRQTLVILKGHAGSGKSVALRRVCYEAATKYNRLCFYVSRQHTIIPERFEEIFYLTNLPVFLFVDNISEHRDKVREIYAVAKRCKAQVTIIGTETFNRWNASCDDLESIVSDVLEMRYLSESNIRALVEKLEKHDSLGYLALLPVEKRINELQHVHGRQLLVALLEATHGIPLMDIIAREYESIEPSEARLLYLDICSLHRFGPPVRAGLISRIHNISFESFKDRFFKPLEQIVILREDKRSGDYVYEARHSYIANTLYERVVSTQEDRFENIIRIVTKLNPNFSYDQEVMRLIVKADNLEKAISDHAKIRQIYDVAQASLGTRSVLHHQRGIFEMHIANDMGSLAVAEKHFEAALEQEPHNNAIKHSLAELDLRRSRLTHDTIERNTWRRSAIERATALTKKGEAHTHITHFSRQQ